MAWYPSDIERKWTYYGRVETSTTTSSVLDFSNIPSNTNELLIVLGWAWTYDTYKQTHVIPYPINDPNLTLLWTYYGGQGGCAFVFSRKDASFNPTDGMMISQFSGYASITKVFAEVYYR